MEITHWVLARADDDTTLAEDAKVAVLAALEGETELNEALGGRYSRPETGAADGAFDAAPVPAFLKSIIVSGFRGIGPRTTLTLKPAPGLVVVAGRNGSGKSSFSEALEVALTGHTYRGQKKQALWRENWRNLHQPTPCRVEVHLAAEAHGHTAIGLEWPAGAELPDHTSWVQVHGNKRQAGRASLGWDRALELYRPLLSYDELGGMLEDAPSRLHDALESILGLEQLTDASTRIASRVKELREPQRRAKAQLQPLKGLLAGLDDARAHRALTEVSKRTPDISAVRALLVGSSSDTDPALARLAALSRLTMPDPAAVKRAADELHTAATAYAEVTAQVATAAGARDALLAQALAYHEQHGDGPCPICGAGTLDAHWAENARAHLTESDSERAALQTARQQLDSARRRVQPLIDIDVDLATADRFALSSTSPAHAALDEYRSAPTGDLLRAAHLRRTYPPLFTAATRLAEEAAAEHAARQDRWAEVVIPLTNWLQAADEALRVAPALLTAEAADKWIKANLADLRNERLEPFAAQSRAIWAQLRQESNVDLGSIRLEGASTRRRVDLRARVDGDDAGALAVMSQGELHALALALFIPRAAAEASPFGFIVLDDPIQAMDPAKIDGFIQVLVDLAAHEQVIVFTHDDRLPDALRQSTTEARILEITRGTNSAVTITNALDPAQRYLDDAYAVAKDDALEPADKARVIPGLCRLAVEATCRDTYYTARLNAGASRADVETAWQQNPQTRQRVRLAVNPATGNLDSWLAAKAWRRPALGICTTAAHNGLAGDPADAVNTVRRLVADLRGYS